MKTQIFYPVIFFVSLVFYGLAQVLPSRSPVILKKVMVQAAVRMDQASLRLKECREAAGLKLDLEKDINATGLIGREFSDITTSLGQLKAKRTTTNPNFAALVVLLLNEAGVKRGDTVAVGASGSFPALLLAVLSACQAYDLNPLVIYSLGASQWGANDPEFFGLEMWDCLSKTGIWDFKPIALSLGGDRDRGENMPAAGYALLTDSINKYSAVFIHEPDLPRNVAARMRLYKQAAGTTAIKAFINIGGSYANLGSDSEILTVKPGVSRISVIPPLENRGVLFTMAAEKVPVIHLLFIRGLVRDFGLPWDPVPLPEPGTGGIFRRDQRKDPLFITLALSYLLVVFGVVVIHKNWHYLRDRESDRSN